MQTIKEKALEVENGVLNQELADALLAKAEADAVISSLKDSIHRFIDETAFKSKEIRKLKRELRESQFTTITTKNFEIKIHVNRESGSFEHLTRGEYVGGELVFKNNFNGDDELVDYDGVYELPREVVEVLEAEDFIIKE